MEYRPLGKTGLNISAIGFGGAPIALPIILSHDNRDDPSFRQRAVDAIRLAVRAALIILIPLLSMATAIANKSWLGP